MPGTSILTPTQVPVPAGPAVLLLAMNANRSAAIIRNTQDTLGFRVYVGDASVTAANGTPLDPGAALGRAGDTLTLETTAAIYAISGGAGPGNVSVLEETD